MLDAKLVGLLDALSETEYVTSKKLAEIIGSSDRTVQTRIRELRDELDGHGAAITSKQRYGYLLVISDREAYNIWRANQMEKLKAALPNSVEERFQYILVLLLTTKGYQKLEDISDQLCVSSKTLSSELKQVEDLLTRYQLVLARKPYYGLRVQGDEFNFRKCCMDYLLRPDFTAFDDRKQQAAILPKIRRVLLDVMAQHKIRFSTEAFHEIKLYLYTAWLRNREGLIITARLDQLTPMQKMLEYAVAEELVKRLRTEDIGISDKPGEILYISAYLSGLRILGDEQKVQLNTYFQEDVQRLAGILLDCVYKVYGLNFRDNLDIRIALYHHMLTFHIRMTYGIPLNNPVLEDVKQNYPFAFSMAQRGMADIADCYGQKISEDEVGYFAIILEMALEASKKQIEKKNILLVCMTGKSSSQFLEFRFRHEFGSYIDQLHVCSRHEFEQYDLRGIDYIFTTVPLNASCSVPIYEIDNFLDSAGASHVRKKLELGSADFLRNYYREELFFPHIQGDTWEAVTENLCRMMAQAYPIPEGFCESVMARERKGSTDFGNLVAIPHPEECLVQENIVSVGILDKPILWSRNTVQMVVLSAVYDSTTPETQRFYQLTSALLSDGGRVERAIAKRSYSEFMKLFLE